MSGKFASEIMRGTFTVENPADPAVSTNFVWTVPNFCYVEFQSIAFSVDTDANVANRYARISYWSPNPYELWASAPIKVQLLNTIYQYFASQASAPATVVYDAALQLALPPRFILGPGSQVFIVLDGKAAGDQITAIYLSFLRHALPS